MLSPSGSPPLSRLFSINNTSKGRSPRVMSGLHSLGSALLVSLGGLCDPARLLLHKEESKGTPEKKKVMPPINHSL